MGNSCPTPRADNRTDRLGSAPAFHRQRAEAFLTSCQQRSSEPETVLNWVRLLAQRRTEVSTSEISQKAGVFHILEDPGRIVFPATEPQARSLTFTPTCQVH